MASILPWLFWCASAALGSLASADLLLLDRQKKWITDRAITFWNWLDDQRELKYLLRLRKFGWQRFVVVLYAVIALAVSIVVIHGILFDPIEVRLRNFVYYLLGTYVGSFVMALLMARSLLPRVLNWVTETESSWAYIRRSTVAMGATVIAASVIFGLVNALVVGKSSSVNEYESFTYPISASVFGAFSSFMITPVFVMFLSWILVVIPVVLVLLLMILFRVVQFVAVRVAENPKGPQYVLSLLLAALGAAAKYFTEVHVP
jgi:hypothetical protein